MMSDEVSYLPVNSVSRPGRIKTKYIEVLVIFTLMKIRLNPRKAIASAIIIFPQKLGRMAIIE
jgi:hypothetical protein